MRVSDARVLCSNRKLRGMMWLSWPHHRNWEQKLQPAVLEYGRTVSPSS
jgi:hypothetical protein